VSDLIADINAANASGGTNTITLTAPTSNPYVLTAVDNTNDGATGLPVIARKDTLTIIGNGDTIERSTALGTPAFRLLDVAGGASLTLENLTLQNGLAFGSGISAEGGGIYNQGTLVLDGATVQQNQALGSNGANATSKKAATSGQDAAGGGIWSKGSLTLENGAQVLNNLAQGGNAGQGGQVSCSKFVDGGNASGGGVFVAGGTATFTGGALSNNEALGGAAGFTVIVVGTPPNQTAYFEALGNGGSAFGGALDVENGTVSLTSVQATNNQADGGPIPFSAALSCGVPPANGYGGGICVGGGNVTLAKNTVTNNTARRGDVGTGYGTGAGGGICTTGGTVTLSGNTVQSNTASDNGGGLYVSNATLSLSGDTVNSNTAANGGGVFVPGLSTTIVSLKGVTVDSNKAIGTFNYDARGGGLFLGGGTITLSNDTVESNSATAPYGQGAYGGGVDVEGATVNLASTLVEYNSVTGGASSSFLTNFPGGPAYGGGIAVVTGTVTLSGDTIEFNTVTGGLNNAPGGLAGNGYGGGLYIAAGTVTLCNDTVSSNTAAGGAGTNGAASGQGFSGGIFMETAPKVYIDSSAVDNKDPTVVNNNTDSSGLNGSTANIDGTYILKNC
jgi:hypothetical protein